MDDELKENLTARQTWLRGLFILVFAFVLAIARVVIWAVVVLQFLFTLFSGQTNANLLSFADSLSRFIYQCLLFVSFNSEEKPFPFAEWPAREQPQAEAARPAGKKSASKKAPARKKSAAKKTVRKDQQQDEAGATPDESGENKGE